MEQFFYNPGLKHIGENILRYLDYETLVSARTVCQSWNDIVNDHKFWLQACITKYYYIEKNKIKKWQNLFEVSDPNVVTEIKLIKLLATMHKEEWMRFRSPLFMALKIEDLETIHWLLIQYLNHQQQTITTITEEKETVKRQNLVIVDLLMKVKWRKTWPNTSGIAFTRTPDNVESLKQLLSYFLLNYPSNSFEERFRFLYHLNGELHIWPNSSPIADFVNQKWDKNEF